MAVTGQSGSGKTMLLAKFVLQIEVNRNEFYWLFFVLILFLGTNGR
jgi:ABC-type lipoprotein export system ATPase subunit